MKKEQDELEQKERQKQKEQRKIAEKRKVEQELLNLNAHTLILQAQLKEQHESYVLLQEKITQMQCNIQQELSEATNQAKKLKVILTERDQQLNTTRSDKMEIEKQYALLKSQNESLQDKTNCIICFSNPINLVLIPCNHSCMCSACAQGLTKCT